MTSRTTRPRTGRPRGALVALGALGLALALTACSASDAATPDGSPSDAAGDQGAAPEGASQGRGGRAPGVSGEIAAVDGTTAQVQDDESQTAVVWSDDTTISVTVDGALTDVTVGSCVLAVTGSLPRDETEDSAGDAATSVAVSEPVDGACTGGFGGFGGGGFPGGGERPQGAPTDMPSDLPEMPEGAPTDMPSGAPDREGGPGGGFGGLTTGLVTAVDGSTITVRTTSPEGETSEESVSVDDATTYTVQRAGTGDDVVVGQCVTAQGESEDGSAFAATSLSVSAPGDDGCTSGFPGGRGGFPGVRGGQDEDGRDA
ncbi:hypothetical protein ABRQ22_15765 [Cellulosimicrobium sp. ES-005]|uniref:DUF5666 domain-containing protein n=1 Tax=Cellulosimicrobium sp. ES-005 TaxID=3163031 RepID=A0AAU8FZZ0_9MICO